MMSATSWGGLGVIHQSSQFAAIRTSATTTKLPSFTRVDAALFYDVSDKVQLQANVENLFDTDYFADAHNNSNITPGAPINGRVTVRVSFRSCLLSFHAKTLRRQEVVPV